MTAIKNRRVFGQLEHPEDGKSTLKEAAIVITNLYLKENNEIWGDLETLSTEAGKTATALLRDGLTIGISSRAQGSVLRRADGCDEVQEDFVPQTFDLVAEPSTPGALLHESLQETLKKKSLTEIKEEESCAIYKVQSEALRKEILESKTFNPTWQNRLNDMKYFIKQVPKLTETLATDMSFLMDALQLKKQLKEQDIPVTPETVFTPETTTYHIVEITIDFNNIRQESRTKFNLYRTGEDLITTCTILKSSLESSGCPINNITGTWVSDCCFKLTINTSVNPEHVKEIVTKTLFVTVPTNSEVAVESLSMKNKIVTEQTNYLVKEQLREQKQKNNYLEIENKNLRILNHEITRIFEQEIIKIETKLLLESNPGLLPFKKILLESNNRNLLHENVQACLRAVNSNIQKSIAVNPQKQITDSSLSKNNNSSFSSFNIKTDIPKNPLLENSSPIADGMFNSQKEETTFSRLVAHRAKK